MERCEISEKGNTRTMIPNAPIIAPAAHAHSGTEDKLSSIDQTDSGTASALSMVAGKRML